MHRRRRAGTTVCLLGLTVAACLPFLSEGHRDPYFVEWQRIEAVRELAEIGRQSFGRYPTSLDEVCVWQPHGEQAWPCGDALQAAVLDGWGSDVWYEPGADGYRIGSVGPDGILGTRDDLAIDTYEERGRVQALAGCYTILVGTDESSDEKLLVLDTTRVSVLRSEWNASATTEQGFGAPKWHPWRHDSILVSWAEIDRSRDLRLAAAGDSLVGVAHSPSGVRTWWGRAVPYPLSATRTPCGATGVGPG